MNGTTQWKVDRRITKRLKLLIWLENTYQHKEEKKRGKSRVGARSRRGRGEEEEDSY
jgi:hypothetical protein